MRSRAVAVSARVLTSFPRTCGHPLRRWWSTAAGAAAGPGDPAVRSEDPQGDAAEKTAKAAMAKQQQQERLVREGGEKKPRPPSATSARKSPFAASPNLESAEVPPPPDPAFQQKRRLHGADSTIEGVSCVGWDGKPLVIGAGDEGLQLDEQQEDRTEDDKEYFKHHKPTPLSELEFADTRKPIRQATDSDVADDDSGLGEGPVVWREEQLDTLDEALLRAEATFREAAEKGDPDTPHGRVLACYQRMVLL